LDGDREAVERARLKDGRVVQEVFVGLYEIVEVVVCGEAGVYGCSGRQRDREGVGALQIDKISV
jgi:hypothetical protein